ncbi:MAG: hypothetical protein HY854_00945 [Burkholderiales bacterium]|nr:hypothetical protein [Burkholderiales bacterium]
MVEVTRPRLVIAAKAAIHAFFLAGASSFAAGGHHAVDDAAILDPGQCELESWLTRARGPEKLLHAAAGCRVGPVELGIGADYARAGGASQTGWSGQVKWATSLAEGFSGGVVLVPVWANHARPRYQGTTALALLTWAPRDDVALHLNLGRDFVHGGPNDNRSGISAEWTARAGWTLLAERYVESQTHLLRGGVRWAVSETLSVDASHAHRLSGPGVSGWTIGATWLLK